MTVPRRSLLKHRSFKWEEASKQLTLAIKRNRIEILKLVGFWEYWDLDPDRLIVHRSAFRQDEEIIQEAHEYINELIGLLLKSAAIKIDGGNQPVRAIISTIKGILAEPRLLRRRGHNIDPGVLGELGMHYQRSDENPGNSDEKAGTHWQDICNIGSTDLTLSKEPSAKDIRSAAKLAIAGLEEQVRQGAPRKISADFLADNLSKMFRRFGHPITRIVDPAEPGLSAPDRERGMFRDFVAMTVGPLNEELKRQGARPYSETGIVKRAVEAGRLGPKRNHKC